MVEDPYRWSGIQARLAAAIRKGAPRHTIIATGARWSSIDQLLLLEPLADGNIIYTFHFYEPHTFTHQSATWGAEYWRYLKNIPYPSNPEVISPFLPAIDHPSARAALKDYGEVRWDASKVERTIEVAADWASKHDVPLMCNEFGVYRAQTPECSRLHWLKDVRTALERHGIGWAMWDYADGFGVAVRKHGEVVSDLQTEYALGLGEIVRGTVGHDRPWDLGRCEKDKD
jgi:endoglucanase